ncbi:endonuclease/exonuclease/phosphatase family protein [Amorphus sp. 3PC139-8]|uniref:endonuclease/exonuclease/phosphatase family protein n=1 Tax=Amorphus sp. 3PC139-8 TaxID=2735676 RepID=UPI00345D2121
MRLATFNLESFGGDKPGEAATLARIALLRARLTAIEADILCLQEVNGQRDPRGGSRTLADLDHLIADTPLAGFDRASAGSETSLGDRHNLVILSRYEIIDVKRLLHDRVPPAQIPVPASPEAPLEARFDRAVLQATIAHPSGRNIALFNAHLRAPLAAPVAGEKLTGSTWRTASGWASGLYLAAAKRLGQALEIRHAADQLLDADPDALIAVAGDLNADLIETPLRMLMALPEDTETDALAPYALHALEERLPEPLRFSARHGARRHLPDHILASRALADRLIDVRLDNEAVVDDLRVPAGFLGSLHAPLSARFDM